MKHFLTDATRQQIVNRGESSTHTKFLRENHRRGGAIFRRALVRGLLNARGY
jgi:hypothetical protein